VARLAGLPATVVARAQEILAGLERDEASRGGRPTLSSAAGGPSTAQLGLFAAPVDTSSHKRGDEVLARLDAIDVDNTTPRQALEMLAELKRLSEDV
jgi:DNA mismatch repair protein MutS